jgi:hypothetical protein
LVVEIPEFLVSSILAITSGITIAVLTHYFSLRRDVASRKAKVVGWLRWLFSLLDGVEKKRLFVNDIKGKLPWWADHMLQVTGDVFYFLNEKESDNLNVLIATAWSDDVWAVEQWGTYPNIQTNTIFDYDKVKKLKEMTIKLITDFSHKDP